MNLADRMKSYESVWHEKFLIPRMPVIIRVDGRAFHSKLRKEARPFSQKFATYMDIVAMDMIEDIQNARFAYIQSDEVSLLLIDYNRFDSQQWFGGNKEKMVSISASIASTSLSFRMKRCFLFDSRVFNLPEREVVNYFIWRQQDATRNSIQMVARSLYSHKQLFNKNTDEQQEMIFQKGENWNDYPAYWKRGRIFAKDGELTDDDIPVFSKNREYIEKFMAIEEE